MGLYRSVADLPLRIESESRQQLAANTTSDFERVTTEITLAGEGAAGSDRSSGGTGATGMAGATGAAGATGETGKAIGRGEDVSYAPEDHDALAETPPFDLAGEWTFDGFSRHLATLDLFPGEPPERSSARNYRRWAYESAALDLALRQADTDLGSVLGREPEPLRFVVSTRLGDPPTTDRVESLLESDSTREFKLDPTPAWSPSLVDALRGTGAVRVLDLKGWYEGTDVDVPADPELYRLVLDAFPEAVIEDAAFTDETTPLLDGAVDRLSFDYPITGVGSLRELPVEPGWCNVKPSRFGSIRSLFGTIEHCWREGIALYGGGQFELGVGRDTIQLLAALLYPEGPNDVAPRSFNDPAATGPFPSSPLTVPDHAGLRWN